MNDQSQAAVPSKNVSEITYQKLLELIDSGVIGVGQVLEERALALRLNVSRTPMRIAMARLLGEGKVTRLSNGLLIVREIGVEEFLQLIQYRRILESEACFMAATKISKDLVAALIADVEAMQAGQSVSKADHSRLDDRLHESIALACQNSWLHKAIAEARRSLRVCSVGRVPQRFDETCQEHLAILRALMAGDAEAARAHMRDHIDHIRKNYLSLLSGG